MRLLKLGLVVASIGGLSACSLNKGSFSDMSVSLGGQDDGKIKVSYSQYDMNLHPMNKTVCEPFGGGGVTNPEKGIMASLFYVGAGGEQLHNSQDFLTKAIRSRQQLFFSDMNVPTRMFTEGFSTQTSDVIKDDAGEKLIEWFGLQFETSVRLAPEMPEGDYELASLSDDGVMVKAKIDGTWKTLVNNDGDHPTRMGCSPTLVHFTKDTLLRLEVTYYQGPRMHIANSLLWRRSDASQVGKDALCGQSGNQFFFDPNNHSVPLKPYQDLLARGWAPIGASSFFIPMETVYNPCVQSVVNPVVSNFTLGEVFTGAIPVSWTTDIPATTQVYMTDVATGETTMTTTDNVLRTTHSVLIQGLKPGTTYRLQAVSVSDSLGKGLSQEITVTTLQ